MFDSNAAADRHGPHLSPSHTTAPDPGWSASLRASLIARMDGTGPHEPHAESHLTPVLNDDDRGLTMLADLAHLDDAAATTAAAKIRGLIADSNANHRATGDDAAT